MTRMQVTESKLHSAVNDTNAFGQWHECRLLSVDHTQWSMTRMHLVNDTNASDWVCITLIGQWHKFILVNDTNAETQAFLYLLRGWSMTPMHFGQWHKCIWLSVNHTQWSMTRMHLVNDTNAVRQAFLHLLIERSMTPMHLVNDTNAGHWVWITLSGQWHECIWSMTRMPWDRLFCTSL